MPLIVPTNADVVARAIADVELALAEFGGRPALQNSWLRGLIVAYANRVFDFYFSLEQAVLEALPDTAVDLLEQWAAIFGVARIQGARSTGNVIISGTVGTLIPKATFLASGAGKRYQTTGNQTIAVQSFSVASITRSGSTATLTTAQPHKLGSQIKITVTGANQAEYNVVGVTPTITGASTLTYQVTGSPVTPATGTILLGFTEAVLVVEAEVLGSTEDQPFDVALKLESPIAGVDDVARVDFSGLGGGAAQETTTALRERLLDRIQNPVAHFNVAEITAVAKSVAGVTRVFVQEITPAVGQVTIYFMRDNDVDSPIPSGSEISAVNVVIQAIRPANSAAADVMVLAPTAVTVNFIFTALTPNTSTMKAAITASLQQFFKERTEVGVSVKSDGYRAAIFQTVDTVTGDVIQSFTLTSPVGDVAVAAGSIGVLGTITYP